MSKEESISKVEWHLTKGLSLSIIALLITNTVTSVWWAATITNDVSQIKERPDLTERVIILEAVTKEYKAVFGRFILTLDKIDATVNRIDREQAKRTNSIHTH